MVKIKILVLFLVLILSGCATTDWNNFWYSNPYGANPDYVRCPHCLSFLIAPPNSPDVVQCAQCKNTFSYAEGKKLYNLYVEEYNKTVLPSQIIAQEQANQAALNRIHDIYQRSAENQQRNMQIYQRNIADWNANWQKHHNQLGTTERPIHVTVDND